MDEWAKLLITVVCSVVASGGFWSYLQARRERKDAKTGTSKKKKPSASDLFKLDDTSYDDEEVIL